jgi:hypothetical protein
MEKERLEKTKGKGAKWECESEGEAERRVENGFKYTRVKCLRDHQHSRTEWQCGNNIKNTAVKRDCDLNYSPALISTHNELGILCFNIIIIRMRVLVSSSIYQKRVSICMAH